MSSHYRLKATIGSTEVVGESLELTGSKPFKVFPVEKNETSAPIRGSAVVNILGKNYSIQLNHRIKETPDYDPSATKWSYIENMYTTGTTPVPAADIKNQKTGYVRASRGTTTYQSPMSPHQTLIISRAYTTYQSLIDTVGDFSDPSVGTVCTKGSLMTLFTFVMFYKYSSEEGGVVIPPTDDGTPASNKARIPCRPDTSAAPDWIRSTSILYQVVFTHSVDGNGTRVFGTWDGFIDFWNSIKTNPEYTDAVFHYIYQGTVDFNESLLERSSSNITVSEIDNGDGIHGAEPLYLIMSQQEGKNDYGAAIVPASNTYLDSQGGEWSFDDLSAYTISQNKLIRAGNDGTFVYKPKFKIKSSSSYYARAISVITGGSVIINRDSLIGTVDYQYIGQPFILKLYKENANGIEGQYMRPYYKITAESSPNGTEFWRDSINILGAQNFNPLQYDQYTGSFHYLHLRNSGYRGFISGPMSGDYGMFILQLIPMCIYTWSGGKYTVTDNLDGEGRVGTKGINYVSRYNRYESAIGGADIPGQNSTDVYKAAFLKWPNADGNNDPDHIDPTGTIESLLSQMGKNWENWVQNFADYKYINRVMMVPVLWTEKRLEEDSDMRSYLNSASFGSYLLSPWISDSDIDTNTSCIYRISIEGLDIQLG